MREGGGGQAQESFPEGIVDRLQPFRVSRLVEKTHERAVDRPIDKRMGVKREGSDEYGDGISGPCELHAEEREEEDRALVQEDRLDLDEAALDSALLRRGIQFVGEHYRDKLVLPAVNTTFDGVTEEHGVWTERCQGCGNCVLDRTLGICPVTRCAKSIFNGPCGGSTKGKCEISPDVDCAWQLVWDRLKALGMEDRYEDNIASKDWRTGRGSGPRKIIREDLA